MTDIKGFEVSPFSFCCINSSIDEVQNELEKIVFNSFGEKWLISKSILEDRNQIYSFLKESHLISIKFLLWRPMISHDAYTVFLTNAPDGWISLLTNYSLKTGKEIVMATFSDDKAMYPLYQLYYRKGQKNRIVQTIKDIDKWKFYTEGLPLEIEDLGQYQKKRIVERFNNTILKDYMTKLGFDYLSDDFWKSMGRAVEYKLVHRSSANTRVVNGNINR